MITSDSEGEYDDDSKASDTDEEEAAAFDGALLEEDDDDYRSEDNPNTIGTAISKAEDPYDIQDPRHATVVTTLVGPSHRDISPSQKRNIHYLAILLVFLFCIFAGLYLGSKSTRVYLD